MDKCLIIDGHNLLFRMFFGLPPKMYDKNHNLIHGVIGFIGSFLKTIRTIKPKYVLVIFDSETGSNKSEIDVNYKANRIDYSNVESIDNPFTQLNLIKICLDILKIQWCEIDYLEADDVIATYTRKLSDKNLEIVILSQDSDLLQLVDENVKVYFERGKKSILYDKLKVEERYEIRPNYISDYKSLIGDKSDNIKGIFGVGHKTAKKLINIAGDIENLYNNINLIEPIRLRELVLMNKEKVLNNKKIITLNDKLNISIELDCLELKDNIYEQKTMNVLRDAQIV